MTYSMFEQRKLQRNRLQKEIQKNLKESKSDLNFPDDFIHYLTTLKRNELRAIMNGISSILLAVNVDPEKLLNKERR